MGKSKNNIFKAAMLVLMSMTAVVSFAEQGVDTIYYDKDWKPAEHKAFASYYRVIPKTNDEVSRKPMRDFYFTGELQSEGYFISIDRNDDSKSVFDGDFTTYFKSGKVETKGSMSRGQLKGEWIRYRENGLIEKHANYVDGKLDGLITEFSEDGKCYQYEYKMGEPVNDWYMVSDQNGNYSKISISDNKPIYEKPSKSDRKIEHLDGHPWISYNMNGISLGMTGRIVNAYGKYYQVEIVISNNSFYPIDFDPTEIRAILRDKHGEDMEMLVYSDKGYMNKVSRRQSLASALNGLSEGIAAANAGYSTSTTTSYYSGYNSSGFHYGTAVSTTTSYDAFAAYQARVLSSNRIAEFDRSLLSERKAISNGYFKRITISPGECVSGYVNVEYKRGNGLFVCVFVNDIVYLYPWDVSDHINFKFTKE